VAKGDTTSDFEKKGCVMSIRRRLALWLCPALGEKPVALAVAVPRPAMDQRTALITLAEMYGAHVGRSDMTVAKRCGVHTRLFRRLKAGAGCRVDTFNEAMQAFDQRWPRDLEWPRDIPRPTPNKQKKEAA